MTELIKKLSSYSLAWKLLLVPVVATLSFAAYLIYSSLVLSDGNSVLKELRDTDFPILDAAGKNLNTYERVVDALNTAAATGEVDYLGVAKDKAAEILGRYGTLEKLDTAHKQEIENLKSGFNAFFALALDVAQRMSTKKDMPGAQQIMKMRASRDAYVSGAVAYKGTVEQDFHEDVSKAIERSEHAQEWGAGIGTLMLFIIAALTLLVTRGIVALERGVAERNKMLAEVNSELEHEIQKLKEAEEAKTHAEAASQIKDEFLANVSHELRTPMNAIIGLSYLCLQTDMSSKQHDYLQKVHGSAKSLLGILDDLLDISKIEAGKMEMDSTPFDLEEVMGNLATIVGNKSQDKNLEFLLETAPDVPSVLIGDPLRLSQVLINLAGNAVKFTEKGEVMVRVELDRVAGDQIDLRFTVKDTGIGMSQQEIDKLFQPFTQADTSITRKFGGTGLGLTISKRLVEMMGGTIRVESTPGAGSKFIFNVLFRKAEKQESYRQSVLNDLRGLRVIAVDDNESSLQILRSYLESFTFDVTVASNGQDALNAIRSANHQGRPFGLVIADWKMPQMDGIELARALRNMAELRIKPKVLLISAYGHNEMLQQIDSQVVDGILAKPFQQSKLFDAVARISGRDQSATGKFRIGAQFNAELVSQIRGARLLLVEDNEINQQVARELLESFGIEVAVAENGEDAIAMLKEEQFDGVLMDMQMPVMDGISATREIRKDTRFSRLPIIALTANVMVSEQNGFLGAGMSDYIGKPIDPDQLVAKLAQWVRPARTAENPPAPRTVSISATEPLRDLPGRKVAEPDLHPRSGSGASPATGTEPDMDTVQATQMLADTLPHDIAGLDMESGLHRVLGKKAFYISILRRFMEGQRDFSVRFEQAVASGDAKTAERLAHTLKGVSGNIGATDLPVAAEALETAVRECREANHPLTPAEVAAPLAALLAVLTGLLAALERHFSVNTLPAQPPPHVIDTAKLKDVCQRLHTLLAGDYPEAETMYVEHAGLLNAAFAGRAKEIELNVARFDFESALAVLQQAMEQAGLNDEDDE